MQPARLRVTPGLDAERHFTLAGDGNALARAVYGARPVAELLDAGLIGLDGDSARAQAFTDLFALRAVPVARSADGPATVPGS